jgi:alpha-2-macroglobulin
MNRSFNNFATLILLSFLFFISACNNGHKQKDTSTALAYVDFIEAYTTGIISVESEIKIRLAFNIDSTILKKNNPDLFSFSPSVKGEVFFPSENMVVFKAKKQLKPAQEYLVEFHLDKLTKTPKELDDFKFAFQTIKPSFRFYDMGLQNVAGEPKMLNYKGSFLSSDVLESTTFEKAIKANLDGQDYPIEWQHQSDNKNHDFIIKGIERTNATQQLQIVWDGNKFGADVKGSENIDIPALDDFKITDTRIVQQPSQHIEIEFSDPLKPKQNLKGLIWTDQGKKFTFSISNNIINAYPSQRLSGAHKLIINPGIESLSGRKTKSPLHIPLTFTELKPEVQFIGKGVILPNSSGLNFPFKAVSLRAIDIQVIKIFEDNIGQFLQENQLDQDYQLRRIGRPIALKTILLDEDKSLNLGQWNNFSVDLSELINKGPGAIYKIVLSFKKEYALFTCEGETNNKTIKATEGLEPFESNKDYWNDDQGYYHKYPTDDYNWREENNPCFDIYYNYYKFPERNLLASDLGIIAKKGSNNELHVFVNDMISTKPVENANINVLNFQLQSIGQLSTDSKGGAIIDLKSQPYLLQIKKGTQSAYLRIDDGSSLSYSKFDVSGTKIKDGLKGLIYGERGVWRPGDSLHLVFILEDQGKSLPDKHPIFFEFYDPMGKLQKKEAKSMNIQGFYKLNTRTDDDAPTGNWLAKVRVGGAEFTKQIKIETVKPNRLKIKLNFEDPVLVPGNKNHAMLEAKWLHGANASGLKAQINMILNPKTTKFEGYESYVFSDPSKTFYPEDELIFEGKLDSTGQVELRPDLPKESNAPGMLSASFITKVFENSGDFSINYTQKDFAPYQDFVGLKMPEAENKYNMYFTDKDIDLQIALLTALGKAKKKGTVTVSVYKINWRWWWDNSNNDLGSFYSGNHHNRILNKKVSIENGQGQLSFKVKKEDWGRYLIRVEDSKSGHSCGTTCYIDWPNWSSRNNESNADGANMLIFSADKEKYNVGEQCQITIPSNELGRALISIENGSKVLQSEWIELQEGSTRHSFEITPEMAPNVFINISLIQPHAQTLNNRPIRLYGIIPILVEDPATRLKPVISMPESLKPEETFEITVSEENDETMVYTIAMVDEGLLDLTNFKTPAPWNAFYAREALGVKTWDMYDYVIGAFGGTIEQMFAIGGDEEMKGEASQKVNRFKPVVKFLGPFLLKDGEQSHKITMPNYVGSVRMMVVAGYQGAFGSAQKTVAVKKPLMVVATLPRVLGPQEEVALPVTVFAMEDDIKNVEILVEASPIFNISNTKKQLEFASTGDQIAEFELKTKSEIGAGKIHITAKCGEHQASYDIEIEVRNPNPPLTKSISKIIGPGQSMNIDYQMPGMEGTNSGSIEISGIPPIDLNKRLRYLIRYPYGCAEQTVSSVFPQLYLNRLTTLSSEQIAKIDKNITDGVNKMRKFQNNNGGIAYWPGQSEANNWVTSYAGQFMLEAQKQGFSLPVGFLENWLKYQRGKANSWVFNTQKSHFYYYQSDMEQAYRLFTLALANSAEFGAMNRLKELRSKSIQSSWLLAAAYASAGQPEVAKKIISNLSMNIPKYKFMSNSFGSSLRDRAMILLTLSLMDEKEMGFELMKQIAAELSSDSWLSTQSTAFCLIAISDFVGKKSKDKNITEFNLTVNDEAEQDFALKSPFYSRDLSPVPKNGIVKIENTSKSNLYVQLVCSGTPLNGDSLAFQNQLKLSVEYQNMAGKTIPIDKIEQGTDFMAIVKVRNPGMMGTYKNMALSQIFPSGWEINNMRLFDLKTPVKSDVPEYQNIRDDRVYTYFDLRPNNAKTFIVLLNASYLGKFYMPGVSCEAMYNNNISARISGQWIEVIKQGK